MTGVASFVGEQVILWFSFYSQWG